MGGVGELPGVGVKVYQYFLRGNLPYKVQTDAPKIIPYLFWETTSTHMPASLLIARWPLLVIIGYNVG